MNPLRLSPLPSLPSDDASAISAAERDSFVDDAVVLSLVAGRTVTRQFATTADLILAADDMDFAGWSLPPAAAAPLKDTTPAPPQTTTRRPAEPVLEESGIGASHRGSHRWWLAGLAGAISTLLFSVLLLSLSSSISSQNGHTWDISIGPIPTQLRTSLPEKPGTTKTAPELTEASLPID